MTERPQPLDELVLTVVVDNETDTLSSVDPGVPQVPEMASLMRRTDPIHRAGHDLVTAFDQLCVACHGFSVLATGRVGAESRSVLFDVGPYGDVWVDNAARLGLDLATIEAVFLSHWHWDHSGGLAVAVSAITSARRTGGLAAPVVVDLHPERPDQRGLLGPTGVLAMLPDEPTFEAIADAGGRVEVHDEPHLHADGRFFGSGAIPRRTSYETGLAGHHTRRGDEMVPDPLIMDERFLAAEVRGRGVTVLSACSHAGIVNACLGVRDHFPETQLDVVLGGYHLAGAAMEGRIEATVDDLDTLIGPNVIAPAHCTGWRAKAALATRFAPGRYGPSVVGSRYVLAGE
jgi:7,8-dihydropterin-6-yl-methyl-4-(beta-D-ribofuranosyl)aminobenzene 5'-phosphate synthase